MDKFQPDKNLDEHKRNTKFYEKLGSTIISGIFVYLFFYYAQDVERDNQCWVTSESNVPTFVEVDGSYNVNEKF